MAERSNAADSKSVVLLAGPGVRIPLSPLERMALGPFFFIFGCWLLAFGSHYFNFQSLYFVQKSKIVSDCKMQN